MRGPHYRIRLESRINANFRWRRVHPRPWGERCRFDAEGLYFETMAEAEAYKAAHERANGAECQIVETPA